MNALPPIDRLYARLALQSVVCMVIALVIMHLLPLPKPYWLPLTAFVLVANSFGETVQKSVERILGTAAGLLAGQVIWLIAGDRLLLLQAVIVFSVAGIFFSRNGSYRVLLFWLSLMIAIVLHIGGAPLQFYAARLLDTAIGVVIVLIVTAVLLPVHTAPGVRRRIAGLLDMVAAQLNEVATALQHPAPGGRTGSLEQITAATRELETLASAETFESGLLRHPGMDLRRRARAAAQLVRALLYVQEMLTVLDGARVSSGTIALIGNAAGLASAAARQITTGEETPSADLHAEIRAQVNALSDAYTRGVMPWTQLQAERRLLQALALVPRAVATLSAALVSLRAG
jgi:uncharacterized membrane protein YccC